MEPTVLVKINALDQSREAFNSLKKNVEGVQETTRSFKSRLEDMQPTFQAMAAVGGIAFAGLKVAMGASVRAAMDAEAVQVRLAKVLQTSNGATLEQIAVLNRQADALQNIGVVSADAIRVMQEEAASFDLSVAAIEKLTPAATDFAVALYGINPSAEQARQAMTGLGKALQGQLELLTKKGYIMSEEQQHILKNGTETQRVSMLVEVLNSNYENLNQTMRQTAQGGMVGLQFAMGTLNETLGRALIPIVTELTNKLEPLISGIAEWIAKNPDLTREILLVTSAIAGLVAVVGTLGIAVAVLMSPITLVIAALSSLALAVYLVAARWDSLPFIFKAILLPLKILIESLKILYQTIMWIGDGIVWLFGKITGSAQTAAASAGGAIIDLQGTVNKFIDPLAGQSKVVSNFASSVAGLGNEAKTAADKIKQLKEEAEGVLANVAKDEANSKRELAETIVAQEDGIAEKKRELRRLERAEDTDANATRIRELRRTIREEEHELRGISQIRGTIRTEIDEAERRASMSAFERKVEDIQRERFARLEAQVVRLQEIQQEIAAEQLKNNAIAGSFTSAQSTMQSAITRTREIAEMEAERMKSAFDRAVSSMSNLAGTKLSGGSYNLFSSLPGRATGGPVARSQPYIVGERGPELFVPGASGSIIPNNALQPAMAGGAPVYITITGTFMDDRAAARRMGDEIMATLRQNMRI